MNITEQIVSLSEQGISIKALSEQLGKSCQSLLKLAKIAAADGKCAIALVRAHDVSSWVFKTRQQADEWVAAVGQSEDKRITKSILQIAEKGGTVKDVMELSGAPYFRIRQRLLRVKKRYDLTIRVIVGYSKDGRIFKNPALADEWEAYIREHELPAVLAKRKENDRRKARASEKRRRQRIGTKPRAKNVVIKAKPGIDVGVNIKDYGRSLVRGETIIPEGLKITRCPSVSYDPRYQLAPGATVPSVFRSIPYGATL